MNPTLLKVSGSYLLCLYLQKSKQITIGSLGICNFSQGFYVYVGSAMNRQLMNRVLRHTKISEQKKKHWHIDFLLSDENIQLQKVIVIPSSQKEECTLAQQIKCISSGSILKFGSSDCDCISHLYYFQEKSPF